jgi:hypothetical protein
MLDALENILPNNNLPRESKAQLFLKHSLFFLGLIVILAIEPFYRQPLI